MFVPIIMVLLLSGPIRSLFGEISYMSAMNAIDDPTTEHRDLVELSEITIVNYQQSIARLEKAIFLQPDNGEYLNAKTDIYALLWRWSSALQALNTTVPPNLPTRDDAENALVVALRHDPIDPALYLKRAGLHREDGNSEKTVLDLERAVLLFPSDPGVRFEAASSYLLMNMNDRAVQHATVLANVDDSYRIIDQTLKVHLKENNPAAYRAYLMKSYLAKAYEILWRASEHDVRVLEQIELDSDEAVDVRTLFYELKGLD